MRGRTTRAFAVALWAALLAPACGGEPPPDLGPVAPFRLQVATGGELSLADLSGRVWVANFIFTRCTDICPMFTAKMAALQDRLAPLGDRVHLVSFTVDPEHDTPEVLAAYARRHGADPARWSFLTGPAEEVRRAVTEGLHVAIQRGTDPAAAGTIFHGSQFVLVDGQGHIRGFYEAGDEEEMEALVRDVRRLVR